MGCLAHMETMEAFAECFPKGVVNFISGPTLPHRHTLTDTRVCRIYIHAHVYAGFGRVLVCGRVSRRHGAWHIKEDSAVPHQVTHHINTCRTSSSRKRE